MIRLILALSLISLFRSSTPAQECYQPGAYLPLVGNPGPDLGTCVEIEMLQSWAFVIRSEPAPRSLVVWSLNDPEAPTPVTTVELPEGAQHLRARGNRLYFTSVDGYDAHLHIWDVTDPAAPTELGTMFIDSQVLDLEVEGNLLAMCTPHFHLSFIDVSDPANPVWLSDIQPAPGSIEVTHVDLFPTHAVCNIRGHVLGIAVVSTLDPSAPVVTSFDDLGLWLRGFTMENDGVHGWACDSDLNLYRVDVAGPGPTLTRAGGGGSKITVFDDLVITMGPWGPIPRVHVQDADGVLSLRDLWPVRTYDIARKGAYLVAAVGSSGLHVRQLTPEVTAPYVGAAITVRSSYNPATSLGPTDTPGVVLELNDDHSRLGVIVYSDPEHPALRGTWACSGPRVAATRGEDVVLGSGDGVRLLRLGVNGDLTDRGLLRTDDDLYSILWEDNLLWLGSGSSDLWLYDMADPTTPILLHHEQLVGSLRHLARLGNHLVVAAFLGGVYVLDVSTPSAPVLAAHIDDVAAEFMTMWGDLIYFGSRFEAGVTVYSLADPAAPVEVGYLATIDDPEALLAHDHRLWVATRQHLDIYALSSGIPHDPPLDSLRTEYIGGFVVAGEYIAIGSDYTYIMRPPCLVVTGVELPVMTDGLNLDVAPNPFNPATTLSLSLSSPGLVQVAVFDLRGRLVSRLLDEIRPVGPLTIRWNGRDDHGRTVAAGVYVARSVSGDGVASAKLVLVR